MKAREREALERMIRQALEEDIGPGDITTNAVVSPDTIASGSILSKTGGVIAGLEFAKILFSIVDDRFEFTPLSEDGTSVHEGDVVAEVKGPVQHLLSSERVLLNFMQRMSGIATMTKAFVETIKGTKAVILDTRKTAPGLRAIDKWAVRIGGGENHRLGLYDVAMIKENHIAIAGGLTEAVRRVRDRRSEIRRLGGGRQKIIAEVRTLDELREALSAGVDQILLDNMKPEMIQEAVNMTGGKVPLEASGNITLQNVREIAETGVDFISVGTLTHSVKAMDLSFVVHAE